MSESGDVAAKAALSEFVKDVDRVAQLLELITVFREFAGQAEESAGSARSLWNAAQEVRIDLPILSGSLLLYLCGRFEYFVKELVGTVLDDLVDKADKYEKLPAGLRREYLTRTMAINANPGKFSYTAEGASALAAELASNLAGINDGTSSMRVDAAAITITEGNMKSDVLVEIFKRVGIGNLWETLGQQLPLRSHLGQLTADGCRKAAIARLDEIMKERNKVAHPTAAGSTIFPDANAVEGVAEYFRVLAQVLVDLAAAPRQPL